MASQRAQKVGELIHKEISSLLIKGLKDPRVGFVTITGVAVTPDLHLARIYFTVMGDASKRKETAAGLKSAVPFMRREIGKILRMHYIPDLLFEYDKSVDYGQRIEGLIKEIHTREEHDRDDTQGD